MLVVLQAADRPTRAMVTLSPSLDVKSALAPLLARLIPRFPGPDSVRDPELKKQNPNYPYFPT